jgi:predicted dienelactone hydrolase
VIVVAGVDTMRVVSSRSRLSRWVLLAAMLLPGTPAHAAETWVRLAGLDVAVWAPQDDTATRKPVVIFSHGFHGCATQTRFLMEALAADGYFVFAPNHRDATCAGGEASWLEKATTPFGKPGSWSEASYRDRGEDIRKLVAAIGKDAAYGPRADLARLGLAGHSLGGYTVLGLAGAWPVWNFAGVKGVLALSPYAQPFLAHGTLGGLAAPVMYQGGTADFGITPALVKPQGAYDSSPMPKYLVVFDQASHFAWTDFGKNAHEQITAYSLAFFDRYVKGDPAPAVLSQTMGGVARLRYASELGHSDGRKK